MLFLFEMFFSRYSENNHSLHNLNIKSTTRGVVLAKANDDFIN